MTGYACQDAATALECKAGAWLALPCKGAGGCKREAKVVTCDMAGNEATDSCASSAEGKGLCGPGGTSTLECRDGFLIKTNACKTCTVDADIVVCQP
jgi:hypothetical protein